MCLCQCFNITDEHNDMILPGAFAASLSAKRKVVFLWQHMVDKPIGVVEQIQEDEHGVYIFRQNTNSFYPTNCYIRDIGSVLLKRWIYGR